MSTGKEGALPIATCKWCNGASCAIKLLRAILSIEFFVNFYSSNLLDLVPYLVTFISLIRTLIFPNNSINSKLPSNSNLILSNIHSKGDDFKRILDKIKLELLGNFDTIPEPSCVVLDRELLALVVVMIILALHVQYEYSLIKFDVPELDYVGGGDLQMEYEHFSIFNIF